MFVRHVEGENLTILVGRSRGAMAWEVAARGAPLSWSWFSRAGGTVDHSPDPGLDAREQLFRREACTEEVSTSGAEQGLLDRVRSCNEEEKSANRNLTSFWRV
jgi:hypothetical protein